MTIYIRYIVGIITLLLSVESYGQNDTIMVITKDTMFVIEPVYITNDSLTDAQRLARKEYATLKRRVYRTYPYARIASEKLEVLNANLAKLKTKKERKKFLKISENYLENEFEDKLKNLSRKDGQILVKLIYRQTGQTTYDLIKDLKSGWSAYWSGKTAQLFNINIKTTYQPYSVKEDYWIEDILLNAFDINTLPKQKPKIDIDTDKMRQIWEENR